MSTDQCNIHAYLIHENVNNYVYYCFTMQIKFQVFLNDFDLKAIYFIIECLLLLYFGTDAIRSLNFQFTLCFDTILLFNFMWSKKRNYFNKLFKL